MSQSQHDRIREEVLARLRLLLDANLPSGPKTLSQIEQAVEEISRDLACELERRLIQDQEPPPDNQTSCPHCTRSARYRGRVARRLLTRHGELTVTRRYYSCGCCGHGFAPLDPLAGLDAGATTPTVRAWMAHLAALAPFELAATTLQELTGLSVSPATVERVAVAVGEAFHHSRQAQALQHQEGRLPQPKERPHRLYVALDGTMTPLRDPWQRDGSRGALVCRYGECKIGVVYEARPSPKGDRGVLRKRYVATLGDVEAFAPLIGAAAHLSGHHFAKELIVLGDGAVWIWRLAARQFPTAIQIVDFYHASEHLWSVARARFGEESPEAKGWVEARQEELKQDQLGRVLTSIAEWQPRGKAHQELREREYHYFASNAERMRYGSYVKKGYHIGSGVVEAACRHVVGSRLDQVGMHWRQERAEAIVGLRAALCSTTAPDLRPYCTTWV